MKYFGNVSYLMKYFKTQCHYARLFVSVPWDHGTKFSDVKYI